MGKRNSRLASVLAGAIEWFAGLTHKTPRLADESVERRSARCLSVDRSYQREITATSENPYDHSVCGFTK
jgi:hypothetical protein